MQLRTDDLLIPQGTTWECHWPVQNSDGTPADLSEWSLRSQIRPAIDSSTILYTWSIADGNASIISGEVVLMLTPETTAAWDWSNAVYDIKLFKPNGTVVRLTQGKLTVSREVTR